MVSLFKGQKVDLTKGNPGLSKIIVGLGWDVNKYDGGFAFDLDAAAFMLGANGRVQNDGDFVFYNNLKHSSGSVQHLGDNLTGIGEGDDEQIIVKFDTLPSEYDKIIFVVNIFNSRQRRQHFGMIQKEIFTLAAFRLTSLPVLQTRQHPRKLFPVILKLQLNLQEKQINQGIIWGRICKEYSEQNTISLPAHLSYPPKNAVLKKFFPVTPALS